MTKKWGPLIVALAAGLWALDPIWRTYLTDTLAASTVVFWEHVIGALILLPFFIKAWPQIKNLNKKEWSWVFLLALVSGVLGTTLFTMAFAKSALTYDFLSPALVQKLQPIFTIALAGLFLREKITMRFLGLVVITLIGSYLISFGAEPIDLTSDKTEVYLLALGAAIAWGSATVISKRVLQTLSFSAATSLRFTATIPLAAIAVMLQRDSFVINSVHNTDIVFLLAITLTTGAAATLLYYSGLRNTKAHVATIMELAYPVVSLIIALTALNPSGMLTDTKWWFIPLHQPQTLALGQIFGIIILVIGMLLISTGRKREEE